MNPRRIKSAGPAAAIAAVAACASLAPGQPVAPATIDASTVVRYRVTLIGNEGAWTVVPSAVSLEAGVSAEAAPTVTIRSIHVAQPFVTCDVGVGVGAGIVPVGLTSLVADAAPTAVVFPTTIGPTGLAEFSGSGITAAATGTANYEAMGRACQALTTASAPCTGPFNLSLVPAGPTGSISAGAITVSGATRTISLVYLGSHPFVSGTTWGKVDIRAEITALIGASQSSCPADFDHSGGLSVQDIFEFLNAWFAGGPGADFNQSGGITVQDIFDFLNAWFAGCP